MSTRYDSIQEAVDFAEEMDAILWSFQDFQEIQKPTSITELTDTSGFEFSACHVPDGYTIINEYRQRKTREEETAKTSESDSFVEPENPVEPDESDESDSDEIPGSCSLM